MFVNNTDVGQLKDDVSVKWTPDEFSLKAGFPQQEILNIPTGETCTMDFSMLEVDLDMIRSMMPQFAKIAETAGTASVTDEAAVLYAAKHTMLKHRLLSGTITVTTTAGTALVEGTDYYLDRLNGSLYRVSTSTALTEGGGVKVSYTYATFERTGFGVGGGTATDETLQIDFWHKRRDGMYRHVFIPKGKVTGGLDLSFKETAEAPLAMTVTALADSSRPSGRQNYEVTEEPAAAAPGGGW